MKAVIERWAVLCRYKSKLDGYREHFAYEDGLPAMFRTRRDARYYAEQRYGYIRNRPDLRAEPHGWMLPKVIRVTATYKGAPK